MRSHDRFPPPAQEERSWVVEKVVDSGELRAPDDSLREQLKRLQITGLDDLIHYSTECTIAGLSTT